ncbi:MAG: SNF2-related protein [Planctomycetota bacterium]|nr:SNF2-related protein [Planctomycetota bacterium]
MSAGPFLTILEKMASENTLARGRSYFRQGRVHGVRLGKSGALEATVDGTRAYEVSLGLNASGFRTDCSCPAWSHEGLCKHVVALACLADEEEIAHAMTRALLSDEPLEQLPDGPPPGEPSGAARGRRVASWRARLAGLEEGARRRLEEAASQAEEGSARFELWIEPEECHRRQALVLTLTRRTARKNGTFGEPKEAKWSSVPSLSSLSRAARVALTRVQKAGKDDVFGWRWDGRSKLLVQPGEAGRALAALDGVVPVYCQEADGGWSEPLHWSQEPWRFGLALDVRRTRGEQVVHLDGEFTRRDVRRPLDDAKLLLPGSLILFETECAPLDDARAFDWVTELRRDGAVEVRGDDVQPFLQRLLSLAHGVPLDLGALAEPGGEPSGTLELSLPSGKAPEGAVTFAYGGLEIAAASVAPYVVERGEPLRIVRRNVEAEDALLDTLTEEGCTPLGVRGRDHKVRLPVDGLAGCCARLIQRGWRVQVERKPLRAGGSLSMRVRSGIDWFDIEAEANFDETALALPAILQAVRDGKGFVTLDDGGAALLPPEWTARLEALGSLAAGAGEDEALRVARARGPLLDALLADVADLQTDTEFDALREALQAFRGVRARREPKAFQGDLRSYQREALGWFAFLRKTGLGGCLADDMGLGKTVQVLATLLSRRRAKDRRGPTLVVAPRSVMSNWIAEARRFAPDLRAATYHGAGRAATLADAKKLDLIVTTYGTMRRDIDELATMPFDYVVLDESQAIKNAASKTARAARALDAKHRLALSGTPIENHLDELGSLFAFLNPGLLGSRKEFQALLGASDTPSAERMAWLQAALRPVILRRTREQVLTELPEKSEQVLRCALGEDQRRAYDGIRQHYRASVLSRVEKNGIGKSRMHVLEALLRLRQAACHPGLIDASRKAETSAKLDQLLPMLDEIADAGHKALVFSQFTQFLGIVRKRLDDLAIGYEYLDGQTTRRGECIERFQNDPSSSVFLISLKAGGTGLNLTAAQYVFILDPWWNPAVEAQAVGRAHRMGQENPVAVYRLIGEGTIEDRVLELQARKRDLAQAVLGGVSDAPLRGMTREDLEVLLG